MQPTQIDIQIDCYGPLAGDWAVMLSTLLFDEVACDALTVIQPLYVDEPRLMPWEDGEAQYETRYMIQAAFQYNPITTIPQQFAGVVNADLIDVDVAYPLGALLETGSGVQLVTGAGNPLATGLGR